MNIIQPGTPQLTRCNCQACNCVFEVDPIKDGCRETAYVMVGMNVMARSYQVKCPWCGHEVVFSIDESNRASK